MRICFENLNGIHQLISTHREQSKQRKIEPGNEPPKKVESGTCLDLATGDGEWAILREGTVIPEARFSYVVW